MIWFNLIWFDLILVYSINNDLVWFEDRASKYESRPQIAILILDSLIPQSKWEHYFQLASETKGILNLEIRVLNLNKCTKFEGGFINQNTGAALPTFEYQLLP